MPTHPHLSHPSTGLTQHGSLRWRGDQYRVLHGHPAGAGPSGPAAVVAATAAPFRLCGGAQRRRPRPPRAAVRRAQPAVVAGPRGVQGVRRADHPLVRLGRPAAGDTVRGRAAVLEPGQPEEGDIRRDVLRQGRVGARAPRVRGQLGQERQRPHPLEQRERPDPDGRGLCRAPAGRQVRHRAGRADVRVQPVRLAVHDRPARHPVDPDAVPDRPPSVPLDVPGLPGRRADGGGRPGVRDGAYLAARRCADVLRAGRVRLSADRPRPGQGETRRRAAGRRRRPGPPGRARRRDDPVRMAALAVAGGPDAGPGDRHQVERPLRPGSLLRAGRAVGRRHPQGRGRGPPVRGGAQA